MTLIDRAPNNASAWNYLRGLFESISPSRQFEEYDHEVLKLLRVQDHAYAVAHPEEDEAGRTPPHALEWLLDSAAQQLPHTNKDTQRKKIQLLLQRLRHADPARNKYWSYVEQQLL
ncbi:protein farnesyltransferase alpha subunit [Malassezia pachydermatis]|uniref:Protein farnesyltransferase alpha subunit n=1 Tax=Malassezia pachydermatis TaxID=77020 RepID=A0A0M9VRD6_9BASI|nr:protein farnesyltransferase alpha subunit [Malassezia pachydermatis]KOS16493.1 protein farnesyltransferase alpha subunit [Malassezia pachydermatis]